MSKLAGGLLVLFGIGIAYVGFKEVITPVNLTAYASYTSLILGALLFIAGLAHFRAPHKAFLMSVPLLLAFQLHMYCVALFFDVKRISVFLGAFVIASVLILFVSYQGFVRQKTLSV